MQDDNNLEIITPTDDVPVEQESGILNYMRGDVIKTAGGAVIGLIMGTTGGVLYATPVEKIEIEDNLDVPVEKLVIKKTEPVQVTKEYSKEFLEKEIAYIQPFLTENTALLNETNVELAKNPDDQVLLYRKKVLENRVSSYQGAISQYQALLAEFQPILDSLPPRNEKPPIVEGDGNSI